MPYFKITIVTRDQKKKKTIKGIREMDADIDTAWRHFKAKAEAEYKSYMEDFNLVQLSKLSDEVKQYLSKSRRPPIA